MLQFITVCGFLSLRGYNKDAIFYPGMYINMSRKILKKLKTWQEFMNVISSLKYFLRFVSIIIFNFSCSYLHLFKGHIIADRGQFLVVFHTHHDIVLYCQSRGLSNHRENGSSYQFRRGLGQAIQDQIRMFTIRIYKRVLSGNPFYILNKKSGF